MYVAIQAMLSRVGKAFIVEMHHQRAEQAKPCDNVGLNSKGLDKQNMPRGGDVMVHKKDTTLGQTKEFDAQIQVLESSRMEAKSALRDHRLHHHRVLH